MDKSLGTLLLSWGVFHVFLYAQPLPSPHKQRWTRVSRIFSECQLCLGWREGELKENVGKDALFYEVTQKLQKIMNTAFLSPRTFVHDCSCGDRYKVFSFLFLGIGDRLLWQRSQRWDIKFLGYWCGAGISVQVLLLSHGKTAFRDSKRILATTRL